jgi:hypothetical protein
MADLKTQIQNSTDKNELSELFRTDAHNLYYIVQKLENQELLEELALEDAEEDYENIQVRAIEKIKSEKVLEKIIQKNNLYLASTAVQNKNFTNQDVLEKLAERKFKGGSGFYVGAAWSRISNEKLLNKFASKCKDDDTDWVFILRNPNYNNFNKIESLAKNTELDEYVREEAIKRISSVEVLGEILLDEEEEYSIQEIALDKLSDSNIEVLQKYYDEVEDWDIKDKIEVRIEAKQRIDEFTNVKALKEYYNHIEKDDILYSEDDLEFIKREILNKINNL